MLLFDISIVANLKFRPKALFWLRSRGLFIGKRFGRVNNKNAEIETTYHPQKIESEAILIEFRENGPFDLDMFPFDISVVAKLKFRPKALLCLRTRGLFIGKRFGRMNNKDATIESNVSSPEHRNRNDSN